MPTTVPTFSANQIIFMIQNVGNWIFAVAMLIAVIVVIIGATYFLTGGSDPNKIATGRRIFLWGAVGLIVAILSRGIFTVLRSILGA